MELGQPHRARAQFDHTLRLQPGNQEALLALVGFTRDIPSECVGYLERLIDLGSDPDDEAGWRRRGCGALWVQD